MACCEDKGKLELAKQMLDLMTKSLICCISCVTNGCCCGESSSAKNEKSSKAACPCC